jgi:ArsR family transcriptional regulator
LRELRLVHKALADVNRLRIVRRLASAEATVAELVAQVGLSQPLVSWHVGRLRAAGLVVTRRIGRETFCRLLPEAFAEFEARQAGILGVAPATGHERAAS